MLEQTLRSAVLDYVEQPPHPSLARWLRCFWFLRGAAGEPEKVVPDGCGEIVLNLADPFERLEAGGAELQAKTLLVGQLPRYITIRPTGRVCLLGIRFEPAGLFALLGEDQSRILGARIELASIAPELAGALEAAACAPTPAAAVVRLEKVLRARFPAAPLSPIERALALQERASGRVRVDALADLCGVSERTLARRFRREVGLSPKAHARVLRFAEVLRLSQGGQPVSWARLAVDCGYTDQAHLIRDFKAFSGLSPTRWRREEHTFAGFFSGLGE